MDSSGIFVRLWFLRISVWIAFIEAGFCWLFSFACLVLLWLFGFCGMVMIDCSRLTCWFGLCLLRIGVVDFVGMFVWFVWY